MSLPHGWSHHRPGARLSVAAARPGVNVNQLLDGARLDPLSGTAVLNGFPVTVTPAATPEPVAPTGARVGTPTGARANAPMRAPVVPKP
ncbi:hypothetical protein [Streptomyces sp. NBC_01363]|uniref:hypothetical protein n=1 Tax=Streptomyces sp. NBC_01363 TaxID=2903840 RepID=UPI00224E67A7|nr:hypothetical protein [Streptomyces sp. NBC_01363]MCX4733032.1 hypothetical protein [Streptomyces sp. NBC_01363]